MSEFLARKIRTYFKRIDVNDDGVISKKDCEEMADKFADVEKATPEQRELVKSNFFGVWRRCKTSSGTDDSGVMTSSICVESVIQQRNDPEFKKAYRKVCQALFGVLDVNGDGYLSRDEYDRIFTGIGVTDTSFVNGVFESLDLNKDGKLSLFEYADALVKYLTTDDERPLWGPIV